MVGEMVQNSQSLFSFTFTNIFIHIQEGDMGICGVAVLMFFCCGDAVTRILICGVAVISNPSVCDT